MFNEKTNYELFSDFQIQHTLSYIVRSFHLKRLIRLRVTQENESGCIFSDHSVFCGRIGSKFVSLGQTRNSAMAKKVAHLHLSQL